MSDTSQVLRILGRVQELTDADELSWDPALVGSGSFSTKVGEYRVTIQSEDYDDEPPYIFEIREGRTRVDSVRSRALADVEEDWERDRAARVNTMLDRLYETARRDALGVEDRLTDLERQLGIEGGG